LVLRDNVLHRRDIEQAYLDAIARAKYEIIIANAYFFPGWRMRNALVDASNRGVKVTLFKVALSIGFVWRPMLFTRLF
jgi:cardiolipin synthase